MLRRSVSYIFPVLLLSFISKDQYRVVDNQSFGRGEHLEYLVHYAFVHAGTATVDVSNKLYLLKGRPCYRIEAYGKSIAALDAVTRIRDVWRSYVDTAALVPHRFYRNIQEGAYKKVETSYYDQLGHKAKVEDENGTSEIKIPNNVQDIASGFYYFRTIDYQKMNTGDTLSVPAILEDDVYNFKVIYLGTEDIKTSFGKINAIYLSPIMPENALFRGKHPIKIWMSNDKNKLPLKIKAELLIGAVEIDLKTYRNLRNEIVFE